MELPTKIKSCIRVRGDFRFVHPTPPRHTHRWWFRDKLCQFSLKGPKRAPLHQICARKYAFLIKTLLHLLCCWQVLATDLNLYDSANEQRRSECAERVHPGALLCVTKLLVTPRRSSWYFAMMARNFPKSTHVSASSEGSVVALIVNDSLFFFSLTLAREHIDDDDKNP